MIKVKRFIIILIIVFTINNFSIFIYGMLTIRLSEIAVGIANFSDVLIGENNNLNYSDYSVINWTKNGIESKKSNEILNALEDKQCVRLDRFFSSIICCFQNKHNSISEIEIKKINDEDLLYPITKDVLSKVVDSAFSAEVIKILNEYYVIVYFVDGLNTDEIFTTAVYKIEDTINLDFLDSYKTENELYERDFPEHLTYYMSSPKFICLWIATMLIETVIVSKLNTVRRSDKTGFGTKPLK